MVSTSLTLLIGAIAVYIAAQQWMVSKRKLKLDLYDRRFTVFEAMMTLIAAIVRKANVSDSELFSYLAATNQARFLFRKEVTEYIREVYSRAVEFQAQRAALDGPGLPVGPERSKRSAEHSALLTWFIGQLEPAQTKFEPYLAFKRAE